MDEPGHLEGNAVFTYLEAFSTDDDFANFWPEYHNLDELKEHYVRGGIGDGTCKKFLNTILNNMLEPARETAAKTMDEVRHAMRIDYFDDQELIRQQIEKFSK